MRGPPTQRSGRREHRPFRKLGADSGIIWPLKLRGMAHLNNCKCSFRCLRKETTNQSRPSVAWRQDEDILATPLVIEYLIFLGFQFPRLRNQDPNSGTRRRRVWTRPPNQLRRPCKPVCRDENGRSQKKRHEPQDQAPSAGWFGGWKGIH